MANKKTERRIPNLTVEGARITFRNFSGKGDRFNPEGRRMFCLVLEGEDAERLKMDGWNVKPFKESDQSYMQVEVRFANVPPKVVMITRKGKTVLDEDSISVLDWAEIADIDLIITPYEWEVNGNKGVKAYLKTMYVTIAEDEFAAKYEECDAIEQ